MGTKPGAPTEGSRFGVFNAMEWDMKIKSENRARGEIAFGLIVSDGCFCLAYILDLLAGGTICILHFIVFGLILSVFLTACWLIYDDYWLVHREISGQMVKKLRIRELERGAAIEFDGQRYQVADINRADGRIVMARTDRPGSIVVQIEGK